MRADPPTTDVQSVILHYFRQTFAKWQIPGDFMQYSHYLRVINQLDMTSSPGYPYLRRYTSNSTFFKCNQQGSKDPERVHTIWNLVCSRLREKDCDPIRLFIKQEAHKNKKIETGMLRLISSVSVIDQIIDHMIFGDFNQMLLDNHGTQPVKTGWSPYAGGHRIIPKTKWLAIDKSSWDWSVQPWIIELELRVREILCDNLSDYWKDLATWRYGCLFSNPVFITSSGHLFKQLKPGVMKSGCVNTIASNSIMQLILHTRVCVELKQPIGCILSLGDDTLQEIVGKEYLNLLSQYCIVKHAKLENEFSGYRFSKTIEPLYKGKHAFNLLHSDPKFLKDMLFSYKLLYHESYEIGFFNAMSKELNFDMPDEEYFEVLFHGFRE